MLPDACACRAPFGLENHEAVTAWIGTVTERSQALARVDRGLATELRDLGDHGPVVSSVRDEHDRSLRAEIPLLPAESPLCGLDVVEPGLRFDDRIEFACRSDAVSAPEVARDGHRHLGAPQDGTDEPRGKPAEEREVRLVPHGRRPWVDAEDQLMAKDRCNPRHQVDIDVGGEAGLDPPNLRVRDPERRADLASAKPRAEPRTPEILAEPAKQELGSMCPRCAADSQVGMPASLLIRPYSRSSAFGTSRGTKQRLGEGDGASDRPIRALAGQTEHPGGSNRRLRRPSSAARSLIGTQRRSMGRKLAGRRSGTMVGGVADQ